MYQQIIWDWNGTILDDLDISIAAINAMFKRRNMPLFESREAYFGHFGFPIIDYYKRVGFDFDAEPFNDLAAEFIADYNAGELKLHDGIVDVLEELKRRGIPQMILSACEQGTLIRSLKQLGIDGYFDTVIGSSDIYAYGKVERAKEWLRENGAVQNALYVGDHEHDAETAAALNCDLLLVTFGHSSVEQIESIGAPVAHAPADVIKYIDNVSINKST